MKLEHTVSTTIAPDEYKKLNEHIIEHLKTTGEIITRANILREALKLYLANGNSAPAQDNEQVDNPVASAETPTKNPFSDLSFD